MNNLRGYGYFDRAAPELVYHKPDGYTSLGEVWRQIRGMGQVGIYHFESDTVIYLRSTVYNRHDAQCGYRVPNRRQQRRA